MSPDQAPLYIDAYDLTRDVFDRATRLPRQHRSVLARHLQESAFDLLTAVTLALQFRERRGVRLHEADEALARLRLSIRLGRDATVISERAAQALIARLDAIGRQLGGWRRQEAAASTAA